MNLPPVRGQIQRSWTNSNQNQQTEPVSWCPRRSRFFWPTVQNVKTFCCRCCSCTLMRWWALIWFNYVFYCSFVKKASKSWRILLRLFLSHSFTRYGATDPTCVWFSSFFVGLDEIIWTSPVELVVTLSHISFTHWPSDCLISINVNIFWLSSSLMIVDFILFITQRRLGLWKCDLNIFWQFRWNN